MESNSVRNHTSDQQNQTTAKRESDLLINSITDRIGRHEVLFQLIKNMKKFEIVTRHRLFIFMKKQRS